ncbi:uncharacterized protein A4U43_C04F7570 [Asparagus officinalis]|uniref:Pentacotripeptide-repeat region of PRORP domain-containing protein n=1 Tax=Asparagus officinalis TaxID=4686 RepID=A0A5P1F1Q9_ASPOF|nr:pentatricopeptide repeat-containing protein At2g20540 [Asparagus officinalis]ONK71347.1 uncharacterized protein A4U43_C04F7570 [Asparagus officinalis]
MRIQPWVFKQIENQITLILKNCLSFRDLKKIHAHALVSSMSQSCYLATQIINVCNVKAKIDYATLVFSQITDPNIFLYNALIRAYTQNNHFYQAIVLYRQMLRSPQAQITILADKFTYPFVIKACAGILLLDSGKQVHAHVFRSGLDSVPIIQNSLIEMYSKCDDLINVRNLFDEMPERDVLTYNTLVSAYARLSQMKKARAIFDSMPNRTIVSWTALICGYTSACQYSKAIEGFHKMQSEGFEPDDICIVSILPACSHLGALELGKWLHTYSKKHGFTKKIYVCNALIEMYSKCGSIDQAKQIFDDMIDRDVITWSSTVGGLAAHGRAREAIELFTTMEKENRVKPNKITFVGVLNACAHGGLLDEGLNYFSSMTNIYGFIPEIEHYGCLIDLLGRSGHITRALEIISGMPVPADAAIWGSLLSACRTHGDINTAVRAMEELVELEPEDSGNYVLLSNAYAAEGRWDGVARLRKMMRGRRLKRTPGCSLIEVHNVVQEFIAGDCLNLEFGGISEMLDLLVLSIGEAEEEVKMFEFKLDV